MSALLVPLDSWARGAPVGDWRPSRFTDTLTGDESFTTEGDKLLAAAERWWTTPEGRLDLDDWQRWLIRRVLETYPPDWPVAHLRGQLRYKQVVISVARQNGKSVLGALLLFYWLAQHVRGPKVGSFASIEAQARIVYNRLHYAIDKAPELKREIRLTKTRGIAHHDGRGEYRTYPAKEDSLQGEPFTGSLYDELHLGDMGLWDAIVIGQRSKRNAMLVGITTAGDDESLLLKRLYGEGQAALDGHDERFGFFVWEAEDDNLTEANMIRANPAVACGRLPLDEAMATARKMWEAPADEHGITGRDRVVRYLLNRFVDGAADAWAPSDRWASLAADPTRWPTTGPVVYGIERTPTWEHATITANRHRDGRTLTEIVATITDPTEGDLYQACRDLARGPAKFAMLGDHLGNLGKRLKTSGLDVWVLNTNEQAAATAAVKAAVAQGTLAHAGDPLLTMQSGIGRLRHSNDLGSRISRTLSPGHVDALLSMVAGSFVAETTASDERQLF